MLILKNYIKPVRIFCGEAAKDCFREVNNDFGCLKPAWKLCKMSIYGGTNMLDFLLVYFLFSL